MPESKDDAAKRAASAKELEVAQKEVVVLLEKSLFLQRLLVGVVVVCLAVISVAGIIGARTGADAKTISAQNNRFLDNFANYMRCLIVNEDEVIIAVGEDAYVALCEDLLYQGTGRKPNPVIVTIPPGFSTTTTTVAE